MQRIATVSHLWSRVAIDCARQMKFSQVKSFIEFMIENLGDEYADQKRDLNTLITGSTILNSINLIEIKFSTTQLHDEIINILKDINPEHLTSIDVLSQNNKNSNPCHIICKLIRLHQEIDIANAIPNEIDKEKSLADISKKLAMVGQIDKAVDVASTISDMTVKEYTLKKISDISILERRIEKAIEIALIMPDGEAKEAASNNILYALIGGGKIERAINFANAILDDSLRGKAIEAICDALNFSNAFARG